MPESPIEQARSTDSAPFNYKARVIDSAFDWGDDRPPATPWRDTVIYEAARQGLHEAASAGARSASAARISGLAHPEVIAHLKHLGVTAVELLPVQAFVPEQFLSRKAW